TDVILDTRSYSGPYGTGCPQELKANLLTILEILGQQTSGVAWFDDCKGDSDVRFSFL
ncbi:hypothetical protein HispidOSU_007862, partial [Sigmodon hispidus]